MKVAESTDPFAWLLVGYRPLAGPSCPREDKPSGAGGLPRSPDIAAQAGGTDDREYESAGRGGGDGRGCEEGELFGSPESRGKQGDRPASRSHPAYRAAEVFGDVQIAAAVEGQTLRMVDPGRKRGYDTAGGDFVDSATCV